MAATKGNSGRLAKACRTSLRFVGATDIHNSGQKVEETVGLEVDDRSTNRERTEQRWSSLFAVA
jgi:hypothetical protein